MNKQQPPIRYNLIVAMCNNNGIGFKGKIPWHIKHDLQHFSKLTKGDGNNAIVMGSKTWYSLPIRSTNIIGLPDRDNFILSASGKGKINIQHNKIIKSFQSIDELENYFHEEDSTYEDIWIIGGAQIYKYFLDNNKINKCYITSIDKNFECDVFFPDELESNDKWVEIERTNMYDDNYECFIDYIVYENTTNTYV